MAPVEGPIRGTLYFSRTGIAASFVGVPRERKQGKHLLLFDQLPDDFGGSFRIESVIHGFEHDLAAMHSALGIYRVEIHLCPRGEFLDRSGHRAGEACGLPNDYLVCRHPDLGRGTAGQKKCCSGRRVLDQTFMYGHDLAPGAVGCESRTPLAPAWTENSKLEPLRRKYESAALE